MAWRSLFAVSFGPTRSNQPGLKRFQSFYFKIEFLLKETDSRIWIRVFVTRHFDYTHTIFDFFRPFRQRLVLAQAQKEDDLSAATIRAVVQQGVNRTRCPRGTRGILSDCRSKPDCRGWDRNFTSVEQGRFRQKGGTRELLIIRI